MDMQRLQRSVVVGGLGVDINRGLMLSIGNGEILMPMSRSYKRKHTQIQREKDAGKAQRVEIIYNKCNRGVDAISAFAALTLASIFNDAPVFATSGPCHINP